MCAVAALIHTNLKRLPSLELNADFAALGDLVQALAKIASVELRPTEGSLTNVDLRGVLNRLRLILDPWFTEADIEVQWNFAADLPGLFFVIATENPVEFRGTYPLPEAQMDRFAMQFTLGYVTPMEEVAVLTAQQHVHPLDDLRACVTLEDVLALRHAVDNVRISNELKRYIVDLVAATRTAAGVQLGASPRASLTLMKAAQALAFFDGQEFVTPERIQELAGPVIAHRLVMESQARFSGVTARSVVADIVKKMKVPA